MKRLWTAWLVVAAALTAAYFLLPNSPESKLVLYNGTGLIAVLCILVGLKRNAPPHRTPWRWFAAGLTSFLTADILYYVLELTHPEGPPFPSIADVFYLGMYPLVIIGLTSMLKAASPERDRTTFVDAAVVGVAMLGALWVLAIDTLFETAENPSLALITQLAYPVMDIAVFTVAARLVVKLHLKHPPFAMIGGALASLAVADVAYAAYNANGTFKTGLFIDAFWLGFYVLFGAAALHPSMAVDPGRFDVNEGRLTPRQLAIMFVGALSVPTLDLLWGNQSDRVVTIPASAVLMLLVLLRVFGLTRALELSRDRMEHEAKHDALTGLANRGLFAERTGHALRTHGDETLAVLFIDLDDFKTVNDSLGHQAGDDLLIEVASRLNQSVRPGDLVARLGGDEFAILLVSAVDRNDVVSVAKRVLDRLTEPVILNGRSVLVSCSIGIAVGLSAETDVDTILRNADVAMYLSKDRGKGRFEFFEAEMHHEAVERLDLKADLQHALAGDQFVIHYQPIFDLRTGQATAAEALLRWRHPDRGMIPPDRFISLAEESGQIVEIGAWVLREACLQAARWQKMRGYEQMAITVNLSMRQLSDQSLLHTVTSALQESGLPASSLILEITESMLAIDAERASGILGQLKTMGVQLAIDDFGTGYSSLSYLKNFPVASIKIDRSFINELDRSPTAPALIKAIVNLAQALGARTVAEGIELPDQASALRKLGCDRGQGYYYCRPLPATAISALLREHADPEVEPLESWRRSSERAQQKVFEVELRQGLREITAVSSEIEQLNRDLHVPVMASWPWLRTWAECFEDWSPLMVGVRRADSGQLVGSALLAVRERAEGTAVVALGHGSSLCTVLQAADDGVAQTLAEGMAEALEHIEGVWSLDLEQVPELDTTMLHLANRLESAQVLPELRVPHVLFSTSSSIDTILSKSTRKQLRRAQAKIEADGLTLTIGYDRGKAISTELIDEVEAVHISRDHDARRRSDLDRPAEREFWRQVVEAHRRDWEIEITSLRLDGELAAYVVALLDGDIYRVYDGRMSSEFAHYSPGRIVETATLERALNDKRFRLLDWMSGVAAEKLLTTNAAEGRARLVATSGSRFLHKRERISASSSI